MERESKWRRHGIRKIELENERERVRERAKQRFMAWQANAHTDIQCNSPLS